jgi:thymidylate synthase (FAD)
MKIDVLDHGYVRLIQNMGSDLDVVNAARVSYDKEVSDLSDSDDRLLKFLIDHHHDSTLRHCVLTFEVYAPLMVARQWYKHAVASTHLDEQLGWNESSRRYVTEEPQFYIPDVWRAAPDNKKQGSGRDLPEHISQNISKKFRMLVQDAQSVYDELLENGVAPEQARIFLPAYAMYVRWRWTVSLNGVLHFLSLRTHDTAQSEIVRYAAAVEDIVKSCYPRTYHHHSGRG